MSLKLKAKPYLLKNKIQNYEWGARSESAYIPQLLKLEIKEDVPYAELWIGSHAKAPSKIEIDDEQIALDRLIENGCITGIDPLVKLPYLLKVLSAGEALSIQSHPNKQQAVHLNKLDPVNYSDNNHKPEIAIALDTLTALAGFRPAIEIKSIFEQYAIFGELLGVEVSNFIESIGCENEIVTFRMFYEKLLKQSILEPALFLLKLNELENEIKCKKSHDDKETLFLELKKKYKNADVGLLSIFLFNHVTLSAGQALFIDAGVPHAYLRGNIIECMANSDNVVRAGLTPKFVDVDNLIEILVYDLKRPEILNREDGLIISEYKVPVSDFKISSLKLNKGEQLDIEVDDKPIVILLLSGEIKFSFGSEEWLHSQGDTLLLPAELSSINISSLENDALAFMVQIPT